MERAEWIDLQRQFQRLAETSVTKISVIAQQDHQGEWQFSLSSEADAGPPQSLQYQWEKLGRLAERAGRAIGGSSRFSWFRWVFDELPHLVVMGPAVTEVAASADTFVVNDFLHACDLAIDHVLTAADAVGGDDRSAEDNEPLTDTEQAVYDLIVSDGPIRGKTICNTVGIPNQSTLTRDIIPVLKERRGVKNKRGAGYYV